MELMKTLFLASFAKLIVNANAVQILAEITVEFVRNVDEADDVYEFENDFNN